MNSWNPENTGPLDQRIFIIWTKAHHDSRIQLLIFRGFWSPCKWWQERISNSQTCFSCVETCVKRTLIEMKQNPKFQFPPWFLLNPLLQEWDWNMFLLISNLFFFAFLGCAGIKSFQSHFGRIWESFFLPSAERQIFFCSLNTRAAWPLGCSIWVCQFLLGANR